MSKQNWTIPHIMCFAHSVSILSRKPEVHPITDIFISKLNPPDFKFYLSKNTNKKNPI